MNRSVTPVGCGTFRDLLLREPDGELSPADNARLRAHLATCAACAREVKRSMQVGQLLRRDPLRPDQVRLPSGDELAQSVVEAANSRVRPVNTARWAGWAAVAAAGLAVMLLVVRGVETPPRPGPAPAAATAAAPPGFWIDDDEQTGRAVLMNSPSARPGMQ